MTDNQTPDGSSPKPVVRTEEEMKKFDELFPRPTDYQRGVWDGMKEEFALFAHIDKFRKMGYSNRESQELAYYGKILTDEERAKKMQDFIKRNPWVLKKMSNE